jgi:hypothetical protein
VLEIGVDQHHHIASSVVDTGAQRTLLAEVARETDQLDAVLVCNRKGNRGGFVAAAIIDDDDLEAVAELLQLLVQRLDETGDVLRLVKGGDDAGDVGRCSAVHER